MSSIFIEDLYLDPAEFSGAVSNACVPGRGGIKTTGISQCDGRSTVFYNGCCRRRNSPCGTGSYLGQAKDNPRRGVCIKHTQKNCPRDCVGDKWQTTKCGGCNTNDYIQNRKALGIKAGQSNLSNPKGQPCQDVCKKKDCGPADPLCNSAKMQCKCGGTHPADPRNIGGEIAKNNPFEWCHQIPPGGDYWCDPKRQMFGAATVGLIVLFFLVKK